MSDLTTILVAVVSSNGLVEVIRWLVNRRKKNDELIKRLDTFEENTNSKLNKNEKDNVRTQLLVLMSDYPERLDEIMTAAHHYFVDLKANWYLTTIFKDWLKEKGIEIPDWLGKEE